MSTLRVNFRLPLPPSINQQYATVDGRRVLACQTVDKLDAMSDADFAAQRSLPATRGP